MSRTYVHRYMILFGPMKGLISDGQHIGMQDYPEQIRFEQLTHEQIKKLIDDKYDRGLTEGIWIDKLGHALYRPIPSKGVHQAKIEITEEGVNYDDVYMDLCVPFDRYNNEIKVGDTLMVASKNEVRRAIVKAISAKPYMESYGIINRKLTVYDEFEKQTLIINDPRATIKVNVHS